jgi:hypothetical protein
MVTFMVVGISQIGRNVDIQVCTVANDDQADALQAKLEELAKPLELKVLRATTTLPNEAISYLEDEVRNNQEE